MGEFQLIKKFFGILLKVLEIYAFSAEHSAPYVSNVKSLLVCLFSSQGRFSPRPQSEVWPQLKFLLSVNRNL